MQGPLQSVGSGALVWTATRGPSLGVNKGSLAGRDGDSHVSFITLQLGLQALTCSIGDLSRAGWPVRGSSRPTFAYIGARTFLFSPVKPPPLVPLWCFSRLLTWVPSASFAALHFFFFFTGLSLPFFSETILAVGSVTLWLAEFAAVLQLRSVVPGACGWGC